MDSTRIIQPGDLQEETHRLQAAERLANHHAAEKHDLTARLHRSQDDLDHARTIVLKYQERVRDLKHVGSGKCAWKMDRGSSRYQLTLTPCPQSAVDDTGFCNTHKHTAAAMPARGDGFVPVRLP